MTAPAEPVAGLGEALKQLLSQYGVPAPGAPATAGGWAQPAAPHQAAIPPIAGVAVPIKVQTPAGGIRIYLSLGPEAIASPQALLGALEALQAAGFPLDIWADRGGSWGALRGGGGGRPWNGGGYGGNGGGYGRSWGGRS